LNAKNLIGKLNWKFDNCPGQNKNQMVIQCFVYLVERGFVLKVSLYHTKNICLMEELMKVLTSHNQVTAIKANESNFHDWDSLFDDLHRQSSGFTVKPHVFSFDHANPTSVSYLIYDGQPVTKEDLKGVVVPNHDRTL
jgi:hypothetical protein